MVKARVARQLPLTEAHEEGRIEGDFLSDEWEAWVSCFTHTFMDKKLDLVSTHPPTGDRIEYLRELQSTLDAESAR